VGRFYTLGHRIIIWWFLCVSISSWELLIYLLCISNIWLTSIRGWPVVKCLTVLRCTFHWLISIVSWRLLNWTSHFLRQNCIIILLTTRRILHRWFIRLKWCLGWRFTNRIFQFLCLHLGRLYNFMRTCLNSLSSLEVIITDFGLFNFTFPGIVTKLFGSILGWCCWAQCSCQFVCVTGRTLIACYSFKLTFSGLNLIMELCSFLWSKHKLIIFFWLTWTRSLVV